jgi:addiction module RelE/StbE family toxin
MVIWSKPAKRDLQYIHDYIAFDSKFYAKRVVHDIIKKSESLNDFPLIGRMVHELEDYDIREMIVYSYRLIYKVTSSRVEILALIHGKQDSLSAYTEVHLENLVLEKPDLR